MSTDPIDIILHCPYCGAQHIDAPHEDWKNPPHKTHECQYCLKLWRPSMHPTNGVSTINHAEQVLYLPLARELEKTKEDLKYTRQFYQGTSDDAE